MGTLVNPDLADYLWAAADFIDMLAAATRPHAIRKPIAGRVHSFRCEEHWSSEMRREACSLCRHAGDYAGVLRSIAEAEGGMSPAVRQAELVALLDMQPKMDLTALSNVLRLGHEEPTAPAEDPAPEHHPEPDAQGVPPR